MSLINQDNLSEFKMLADFRVSIIFTDFRLFSLFN